MKLAQNVPLGPITGLGTGYQTSGAIGAPLSTAETLLSNVTGFLTVAGGVTFMIYVILAGLTWITAREESERISRAKQMFTNALVGLAILVIAWAFTGVMETIFGFNILSPKETLEKFIGGGGGGGGGGSGFGQPGGPQRLSNPREPMQEFGP